MSLIKVLFASIKHVGKARLKIQLKIFIELIALDAVCFVHQTFHDKSSSPDYSSYSILKIFLKFSPITLGTLP